MQGFLQQGGQAVQSKKLSPEGKQLPGHSQPANYKLTLLFTCRGI